MPVCGCHERDVEPLCPGSLHLCLIEARDLLGQHPIIPRPLDSELMAAVERQLKVSIRGQDDTHRAVRGAFWGRLKALQVRAAADAEEPQDGPNSDTPETGTG